MEAFGWAQAAQLSVLRFKVFSATATGAYSMAILILQDAVAGVCFAIERRPPSSLRIVQIPHASPRDRERTTDGHNL